MINPTVRVGYRAREYRMHNLPAPLDWLVSQLLWACCRVSPTHRFAPDLALRGAPNTTECGLAE